MRSLDGTATTLDDKAVESLRAKLGGELLAPATRGTTMRALSGTG